MIVQNWSLYNKKSIRDQRKNIGRFSVSMPFFKFLVDWTLYVWWFVKILIYLAKTPALTNRYRHSGIFASNWSNSPACRALSQSCNCSVQLFLQLFQRRLLKFSIVRFRCPMAARQNSELLPSTISFWFY